MDEALELGAYDYGMRTPSPRKNRRGPRCEYSDRLIPSRATSDLENGFGLMDENRKQLDGAARFRDGEGGDAYDQLLRSELLGTPPSALGSGDEGMPRAPGRRNLFHYRLKGDADACDLSPMCLTPLRSANLASTPRKPHRAVPQEPFRVLHAPCLEDDFYVNPIDVSRADVLAVSLCSCVDVWSASANCAGRLCDLGMDTPIASVKWAPDGCHLAVGTKTGEVQVWDAVRCRKVRTLGGHCGRVGALAWNGCTLLTGSQDCNVLQRDVRQRAHFVSLLRGHSQEICGLRWSHNSQQLASGGNDGNVCVWSLQSTMPELTFGDHEAAVKAIAWSPHRRGLLATGGGTADKCIRMWNTLNGSATSCTPTSSQVCNLAWSEETDEIVSTHGYASNDIVVWRHPTMTRRAVLSGHKARVLFLAASPDGQGIVTGSGDETLRFWSVFRGPPQRTGLAGTAGSQVAKCLTHTIR